MQQPHLIVFNNNYT